MRASYTIWLPISTLGDFGEKNRIYDFDLSSKLPSSSLIKPCLGSQFREFWGSWFFAYFISRFAAGVGSGPYQMAIGVALLPIIPPSGISSFTNTSAFKNPGICSKFPLFRKKTEFFCRKVEFLRAKKCARVMRFGFLLRR